MHRLWTVRLILALVCAGLVALTTLVAGAAAPNPAGVSTSPARLSLSAGGALDLAAAALPTASIAPLPTWTVANSVAIEWSGTPAVAPITSYDIQYRRAPWNGSFSSYAPWISETNATRSRCTVSAGFTYCFEARARDADGLVSDWTAETCTGVPLDDRSLARVGRWTAGTGSAYYRSTWLRSYTYGKKLTRPGAVAKQIALVATTCPTCGTVKVYWNSTLLKTVSLYSATRVNAKVIHVKTFKVIHSGTVTIKVVSSGKKVIIDGVGLRRN